MSPAAIAAARAASAFVAGDLTSRARGRRHSYYHGSRSIIPCNLTPRHPPIASQSMVLNNIAKTLTASTTSVTWTASDFSAAPISLNVAYSWVVADSSGGAVQTDHTFGPTVSGVIVNGIGVVQSLPWVWNGNPAYSPTLTFTSSVSSLSYYVDT